MKKNPQEKLQEGLAEPMQKGWTGTIINEPINSSWRQKGIHRGKSSGWPVYANSNTLSHESEQDIMGFYTGPFGSNEDIQTLHQILSHTGTSRRDKNSSNVREDPFPWNIDGSVSLIYIDHVNISDWKEIFPDQDEVSQEIEALNKRVYHLISLRKQKEKEKENETKAKIIERDRLLRCIVDLELFTQEEPESKEEGPIIRENLTAKISSTPKFVVQTNREVHTDPQPTKICNDKEKQKVVETRSGSKTTNVVSGSGRVPHGMSLHKVEVERMRKEKENL